ncbi:hypothetical protein HII31_03756 [Pseudocercospora fuligena]|uniref:Uncharacterized protein n=1 Tax=Pseudocercospora fuligena TaxID=685502 RepID=A0A8H6RP30_9PEZI|nr:hypothetical protein HII31_03756 [Pseudocercospora fuligena]
MATGAANGGAQAVSMPPWHDQIIDASCMPAALGKPSAARNTLNELATLNMNLSDAQIFTGHLHPNDICGTLADDLGKRFSNALFAVGLRILDYACKGSYKTSNFIVARINAPRRVLRLPASTRPKALPASETPSTVTYVLMDQGQHAGQWVKIDVVENDLSTSIMTPNEVQNLNLSGRLATLRQTAGTQPALPARVALQQVAQPAAAAAAVPTLPSAVSTVASNNSSHSATNNITTSQAQSISTSATAPALVPQHANNSANSSQYHITNQPIDPSLASVDMVTLPVVQQDSLTSTDPYISNTTPNARPETSDVTSGTNSSSSTQSTATEDTRATSPSALASPTQSQSIARTRPTVAAVQARKRRIGETANQEGPEASSPKRVRKDSGKVLAVVPEDLAESDRSGVPVPSPAVTPTTGAGNGQPATHPMPSNVAPANNTIAAAPSVEQRPRRILRTKRMS